MHVAMLTLALAVLSALGPAHAAGGDEPPAKGAWAAPQNEDPAVNSARKALAAGDYAGAQLMLKVALASKPGSADLNNLYAYALRKGPQPDMVLVFKHYQEALRIDPKHRGAHEYIGEAYLMSKDLAKAKQHLEALNQLCFFGCSEYDMLKKAVASYEASQ